MMTPRANWRAVWTAQAASIGPSRRWTCQSSGRRIESVVGRAIGVSTLAPAAPPMLIACMNAMKDAIAFAQSIESKWAADMKMPDGQFVMTYDSSEKAPDNEIIGPVSPRGGHSGMVYRGGKLLAEWGDTSRADMTFSVAKSFLSLLAGLAVGDGLIKSLDDKVGFTEEQNKDITWRHLLTQT